jgi:superfamily II DNA or RNA helicase
MNLKRKIQLREWQNNAIQEWISQDYKGIINVVTGGGKTIFGIYSFYNLNKNDIVDNVIVIVPSKTLQDQWAANFLNLFELSESEISYNVNKVRKVNILINLTAQKLPKLNYNRTLLIADECHRYGTENNLKFLSLNFRAKIGLTATLERKYDDGVAKILKPYIGDVVYNYTLKQAIKDSVVTNYNLKNIRTNLISEEQIEYDKIDNRIRKLSFQLRKEHDIDLENKIKLLLIKRKSIINNSFYRSLVAVKLILSNLDRKKIIFTETISQAENIKSLCKEQGLDTLVYHSKMSRKDRLFSLRSFLDDDYHTLIGCKSLDEGFDVPNIDMGIIVSQSTTSRQRIQRLGRTIRLFDNKKTPIIYTLFTTSDEKESLYEEMMVNTNINVEWMEMN